MRRASLVYAKAHLSELVDDAEHRRRAVIILRYGKPAAAIVPLDAMPVLERAALRPMTAEEATAFMDRLVANAPSAPAMDLEEALGRNRLDKFCR